MNNLLILSLILILFIGCIPSKDGIRKPSSEEGVAVSDACHKEIMKYKNNKHLFTGRMRYFSVPKYSDDLACFTGDVHVDTPRGSIPISDIGPGDEVYSYDSVYKKRVIGKVTHVKSHDPIGVCTLNLSNKKMIGVTPNHRFYSKRFHNYYSIGEFIYFKDDENWHLDVASHNAKASEMLEEIEIISYIDFRVEPVFNLEIKDYRNYYVEGILVHNPKD